jgi:CheY-like chemotaxis protein
MMPGMDGFAALAALRRLEETAHVPVLACTARADEEAVRRLAEVGFAAHLVKPYDASALVGELHRLLRPTEGRVARRR